MSDFIIVLRTEDAVKTFTGNAHFSIGAGLNAAAGIVGRAAKAGIHAGASGYAACYTYSCSKGICDILCRIILLQSFYRSKGSISSAEFCASYFLPSSRCLCGMFT